MREYLFVFGREPDLSFLEVISYFQGHDVNYKLVGWEKEVAIFLLDGLKFD